MDEIDFSRARCLVEGHPPRVFYLPEGAGIRDVERAKAVCSACPISSQCLEYAIENHEQGVWGGTTERERLRIRRDRRNHRRQAVAVGAAR